MEENPPYPFQRIKHVDGKDTGVIAIIAPFYDLDYYKVTHACTCPMPRVTAACCNQLLSCFGSHDLSASAIVQSGDAWVQGELARAFFWRLKANGHIVIIITSYQEFPGRIENPYDDRHTTPQDRLIHEAVDGYVHCFR